MNTIPSDQPSVFDALNTLVLDSATLAIVRPDNPPPGIAGFVFSLPEEERFEIDSDITNHFVEENISVQDQIALRPELVTLTGQVAELVQAVPVATPVAPATDPLPDIPGMEPEYPPGAEQEQAEAEQEAADTKLSITSTQSLYGYYTAKLPQQPNQTKQSVAFGYIYQLWKARQLFSVETPWGFMTNMGILSASMRQPAQSRSVTELTITFQKIRTVRSITIQPGRLAGRAMFQQAPVTQNGTIGQRPMTDLQEQQFLQRIGRPTG